MKIRNLDYFPTFAKGRAPDLVILDGCCRVGGITRGYKLAAALLGMRVHIVGIDIEDVSDVYVGDDFIQGDVVEYLLRHGHRYDMNHASFPCQAANPLTVGTNAATGAGRGSKHVQLIPGGREALLAAGRPYVIENTDGAPIRRDLKLVGDMFRTEDGGYELAVQRRRWFELHRLTVPQPPTPKPRGRTRGWRHGRYYDGPYVAVYGDGGGKGSVQEWQAAMGIDWTDNRKHLAEAVPPAYARYIGLYVLPQLVAHRLSLVGLVPGQEQLPADLIATVGVP